MLFMSYTFTRHVQSSLHSSTTQHPFNWIRISNFTHNRFMHLWWLLESNSRLFFHTSFIHRLLTLTLLQTHHLLYSQIPTTPPCIISSYHKSYIFFSSWYHSSSITQTQIYCPYLFNHHLRVPITSPPQISTNRSSTSTTTRSRMLITQDIFLNVFIPLLSNFNSSSFVGQVHWHSCSHFTRIDQALLFGPQYIPAVAAYIPYQSLVLGFAESAILHLPRRNRLRNCWQDFIELVICCEKDHGGVATSAQNDRLSCEIFWKVVLSRTIGGKFLMLGWEVLKLGDDYWILHQWNVSTTYLTIVEKTHLLIYSMSFLWRYAQLMHCHFTLSDCPFIDFKTAWGQATPDHTTVCRRRVWIRFLTGGATVQFSPQYPGKHLE